MPTIINSKIVDDMRLIAFVILTCCFSCGYAEKNTDRRQSMNQITHRFNDTADRMVLMPQIHLYA
ncbi:MAG: hypothetical protein CMQ21_06365 [Gammaproteobacteria bacterium]|nr:hypothetical protein [Gammaproteobacteria bacterium]